jgi:hypothetical protein
MAESCKPSCPLMKGHGGSKMVREEREVDVFDGELSAAHRAEDRNAIEHLDACFGGYAPTLYWVRRLLRCVPVARAAVVVDAGGGRGEFGRRLVRWARQRRQGVRLLVVE